MKYGDFKKECKKTEFGRWLFQKWIDAKVPLGWAMDMLIIYKKYGKKNTS